MAQRADTLNIEPIHDEAAPVVPLRIEKSPRPPKQYIGAPIGITAAAAYRNAQARAARSCSLIVQKSGVLAGRIRRGLQKSREEKSLQIVALAAASAFILGIILRVWRSKKNE